MVEIGAAFGRFQILHQGHMEYLLAAKQKCRRLLVGISNPDPGATIFDAACPHRSEALSNPLTYFERLEMTQRALLEAGLSREEFTVVPLPINQPALLPHYVPREAVFFLTVYDDWGWKRKAVLEQQGYTAEVLWVRTDDTRITSGTQLREKLLQGQPWAQLVPPAVYAYLGEIGLEKRLRTLTGQA